MCSSRRSSRYVADRPRIVSQPWLTLEKLIVGILLGVYEAVSLLFLDRRRAINPVAVGLDVALTGTGIFCFLILSSVDRGTGVRRGHWFEDMRNAMILMIVFSWVAPFLPRRCSHT